MPGRKQVPHLVMTGAYRGFSRVAAAFSSYDGMPEFFNLGTSGTVGQIIFVGGAMLCIVGCLAVSLASTQVDLNSTPPILVMKNWLQTWPNVPWGAQSPLVWNLCYMPRNSAAP